MPPAGPLAPLRHAPFRFLLAGRVVSMTGNAVAPIALAFAVLDLTGSALDLGLVVGARSLTTIVFILFGGVVADRLPRSVVMVASSTLAAASQAAVAALVLTHTATIPLLLALSCGQRPGRARSPSRPSPRWCRRPCRRTSGPRPTRSTGSAPTPR